MKRFFLCILLLLIGCGKWYELEPQKLPIPKTIAAYTLCDFKLCHGFLKNNDLVSLNHMLTSQRCFIATNRYFEPTIVPTEEQDYIVGIIYPEGDCVFINKDSFVKSPNQVLGKEKINR